MQVSTHKPILFFVHGSWHTPAHFDPLRSICEQAGFETHCPSQPSTGATPNSSTDFLASDAAAVRTAVSVLVEKGKDVIVVCHSYGGVLASEAIHDLLSRKARAAEGKEGGVVHIAYLCAFIIPEGESLASALGGSLPPYITLREDGNCWMEDPSYRFYNDLSPEDQEKYTSLLTTVPTATQFAKTSYTAYKYYPCTYLFCEDDQALPLYVQQMMVEVNGGQSMKTQSCDAGHSPYLSRTDLVLRLLEGVSEGKSC